MPTVKEQILALVPKHCLICGADMRISDDLMHLTCTNPNCSGKLFRRLENFAKAFDIDNIGISTAQEIADNTFVKTLADMYKLTVSDLLNVGRFKEGMATKIYNSIQSRRQVNLDKFIAGCQIDKVGKGTAMVFANKFKTLQNFLDAKIYHIVEALDTNSDAMATMIFNSKEALKEEILALAEEVIIIEKEGSKRTGANVPQEAVSKSEYRPDPTIMGMFDDEDVFEAETIDFVKDLSSVIGTCVITGELSIPRSKFQEKYETMYNIKFGSSVSSNTKYLICNNPSNTSKFQKARKFGTAIVSEQEFMDIIKAAE